MLTIVFDLKTTPQYFIDLKTSIFNVSAKDCIVAFPRRKGKLVCANLNNHYRQ